MRTHSPVRPPAETLQWFKRGGAERRTPRAAKNPAFLAGRSIAEQADGRRAGPPKSSGNVPLRQCRGAPLSRLDRF